ncbi:MAG: histidine kinase [Dehalococcoidales bacterium]|nr:histidine kinase [Dehalococcoidales bacterium]
MKTSFWRRVLFGAGAVSIQVKITGIVAMGIIVSFAILVWLFYQDTTNVLRNQLQQHGIAISTTLAKYSGDLVLSENLSSLYQLVNNVREADKGVVYVVVLNTSGDVLVQTFDEGFPVELLGRSQVLPGEPYHIKVFQAGRDTIYDVAVLIPGDKAGIIRLGLSEASINAVLKEDLLQLVFWPGLICTLWLFVAYGFSLILTGPAYRLLETTRGLGQRGSLQQPVTDDEKHKIGDSSDNGFHMTFDEMGKELKRREIIRLQLIGEINHGEEIRQQLLNKVINAQEEERKRIARELHDQTAQSLTSLMVGLKVLQTHSSPEIQKSIADLNQITNKTLADIHNLAIELRPSSLDDLGLIAALRQYTKEYAGKFGVEVGFQSNGLEEKRLSPIIEITLYRIVQEALTNVVKHGMAKNVSVLIATRGSSIIAIVEDDGKGFDVDAVFSSRKTEQRLGLYGMQERASVIGGVLTIESTPGVGTTIFIEVPLKEGRV